MELGTTWQYLIIISVTSIVMIWLGRVTSKAKRQHPSQCDSMDSHLPSLLAVIVKMLKHIFSCQDLSPATDTVNGPDNAGCKLTRVWAQESQAAATWKRRLPGQTQIWSKVSVLFLPELFSFVFCQSGSQECTLKSKDLVLIKNCYISDALICKHPPCEQLLPLKFFF